MLTSIMQAGQVPAGSGDARADLEAIRRYLTGLVYQLESILLEIDKRLEAIENGDSAENAERQ